MNQIFKTILKAQRVIHHNGSKCSLERVKQQFQYCPKTTSSSYVLGLGATANERQVEKKNLPGYCRTYAKSNIKVNQNVVFSKMTTPQKVKRKKIRDAIEDKQKKFQREMENALEEKKASLTNTKRKIQEKGKLIMQDIKETKDKMKERLEEVVERENVYTIPNFLCVSRIGLSPLLGYLIISQHFQYALIFMIIAGISDWIDGWIARNYKSQSSKIGSFLDPMADKVLIGTLFLSLTYVGLIPMSLTGLIIGRDIILIISGFVIRYQSLPPPRTLSRYFDVTHATAQLAPTFISKCNTGVQLTLVASTLAAPVFGYENHYLLSVLWYITAISTVVSATSYIFSKETYKFLKNQRKHKKN